MINDNAFQEYLTSYSFYIGYARYNQFPGKHIVVATYGYYDEKINELVTDLDADDNTAINSANKLVDMMSNGDIYLTFDNNIIIAMSKMCEIIHKDNWNK